MTQVPPPSPSPIGDSHPPSDSASRPPSPVFPASGSPAVENSSLQSRVQVQPPAAQETETTRRLGAVILTGSAFKPLMKLCRVHHALLAYRDFTIPQDTVIVLATNVFDGVGDLEHLIHAARHLLTLRAREPFSKLIIFLSRGANVPEEMWLAKIQPLEQPGLDGVFYLADSVPNRTLGPNQTKAWEALFELQKEGFCEILVSSPPYLPNVVKDSNGDLAEGPLVNFRDHGFIGEYRPVPQALPVEYDSRYPEAHLLEDLGTGLLEGTVGLWMDADPVFHPVRWDLSMKTTRLLFGSDLAGEGWDVGVASLRDDFARLAWINLRLAQVPEGKNCVLCVSSFRDSDLEREEIKELGYRHGFSKCILVDREGCERMVLEAMPETRTLRVVHVFISEEELPMLIQRASSGSLGGAGDTACARGLLGEYPVFIDCTKSFDVRWRSSVKYLTSRGFTKVAAWIQKCIDLGVSTALGKLSSNRALRNQTFYSLVQLMTPELVLEWKEFCRRVRTELEIGPWIDLYVCRCAVRARGDSQEIQQLEEDYLKGLISEKVYTEGIKKALKALRL